MASQQSLIAETIRGMKLALKRRDDESDSDTTVRQHTNRGNKLKRKAHGVRSGRLDATGGLSYKKRINHAGYDRMIIHENPPLYDIDGDPVDADEEYDEDIVSPVEENPFGDTKLEELLMPLTSTTDLATHPVMSLAYTTKHITEMAENARQMLYQEREMLWKMKRYLQRLRGDELWAPLESMETTQDALFLENDGMDFLHDHRSAPSISALGASADGSARAPSPPPAAARVNGGANGAPNMMSQEAIANGIATADMARQEPVNGTQPNGDNPTTNGEKQNNGASEDEHDVQMNGTGEEDDDAQPSHAMTTRAKARTPPASDGMRSTSPSSLSSLPFVSAFFLPPATAMADQSLGLPAQEAEETRRLMLLYVQKQEETVRATERLLFGLLRADRSRQEVWAWCRAESHVGEMSDGEDWYDREAWGLEQDLVKGKEEEEAEDETKRRVRRREAKPRNAGG